MTRAENESGSRSRNTAPGEPGGDHSAAPDWRNSDHYRDLARLDQTGWAWEWLRRHLAYQQAIQHEDVDEATRPHPSLTLLKPQSDHLPRQWGLCFRREHRLSCHACTIALGWPARSVGFDSRRRSGLTWRFKCIGRHAPCPDHDSCHLTEWWRARGDLRRVSSHPIGYRLRHTV